jgi:hypothetical protein
MKCAEHGADGCADCKPAMRAAWTVRQLKAALAPIPDDTPLKVNVADPDDPGTSDEQVIVSAGFGTVDWGDGYGFQADTTFALNCEWPEELLCTRPDRPRAQAGLETAVLAGCQDYATAIRKAEAMIQARHRAIHGDTAAGGNQFWDGTAAQLLGCYLHAAALAGLPVASVEAWLNNRPIRSTTPTEILFTHPGADRQAGPALRRATDPRTSRTRDASCFVAASAFLRATRAFGGRASLPEVRSWTGQ